VGIESDINGIVFRVVAFLLSMDFRRVKVAFTFHTLVGLDSQMNMLPYCTYVIIRMGMEISTYFPFLVFSIFDAKDRIWEKVKVSFHLTSRNRASKHLY
jgi:hypothetical protein